MGKPHEWGRFLVKTTCTACHNSTLQGYEGFTPNLDVAGAYSEAELGRLLTTGEGKVKKDLGMMSDMARNHFSQLTPRERDAIVDYVLARAGRIEQFFDHYESPVMMLNHPGQEQFVELGGFRFS